SLVLYLSCLLSHSLFTKINCFCVADRNMSRNIFDQYEGGGVCINCTQNTAGINCETCIDGFYRAHKVKTTLTFIGRDRCFGLGCQPCKCNLTGSLTEECSDEGQCHCILGVAGEKCDRCAHGFYNFQDDGCTRKFIITNCLSFCFFSCINLSYF
uniref:Laminin, alpha 1 n=1 Tax=Erpetoichthys calabaricus TaxID=27687 RepID=A0A8C4X7A7_ERPCA